MNKIHLLSIVLGFTCVAGIAHADQMPVDAPTPAEVAAMPVEPVAEAAEGEPIEVGNKICPVSNEEIGSGGMTPQKITYNGKIYNLCCGMCAKDFNKDPEKYIKIVDEEMQAKS